MRMMIYVLIALLVFGTGFTIADMHRASMDHDDYADRYDKAQAWNAKQVSIARSKALAECAATAPPLITSESRTIAVPLPHSFPVAKKTNKLKCVLVWDVIKKQEKRACQ